MNPQRPPPVNPRCGEAGSIPSHSAPAAVLGTRVPARRPHRRRWGRLLGLAWSMAICLGLRLSAQAQPPAAAPATAPHPAPSPGRFTASPAERISDSLRQHTVQSEWQPGEVTVRVLLPDSLPADPLQAKHRLPVVYVLPVEAQAGDHYGDGLREVAKLDLANRWQALFVVPTFAQLPWYADHPTDPLVRQESHFVRGVVPWVERTYPARRTRSGRLLLGFSKSGWGAWSLLLRHPDLFERAVAWDAPLLLDRPGPYGSGDIFGSPDNFAQYQLLPRLRNLRDKWTDSRRLILPGHANFRREHLELHRQLTDWQLPHDFVDTGPEKHDWHSGWVEPAVRQLLTDLPE